MFAWTWPENYKGPTGHSIPAQVLQTSEGVFKAEFVPRMVGEHRVNVTVQGKPTAGSPYSAKVKQNYAQQTFYAQIIATRFMT